MPWVKLELPSHQRRRELNEEFRGRARFLVDESMGEFVARVLHEEERYNTKYVGDVGLLGRSDEDVFAYAWKEDRIILTHDPDFLDDRGFPPNRNPGIVLIRPGSSGRDNRGLKVCLIKMLYIAGDHASWFRGRKLDYSSESNLTITSQGTRQLYKWERNSDPMVWED
jgi:predicted nuclease of predicted toxin-antitoxin system